jgi:ectoine hydroxylase-related dioxygenase (phytanoyl-CoA dioxygenase family)
MNDTIFPEQITAYRDNGFLVVENFLDADELDHWRQTTDEAVEQRLAAGRGFSNLNNQGDPDNYYAQVFTQAIKLADTHEGMRRIMLDPRLGRMAATLAGVEGVRIWHDQALYKPPFGNPTAWHLDNPYWSFSSRDAISLWVALDDATLANGCMWYVPGSHKTATFDNVGIGQNLSDLFKKYPDWRQIAPVGCPCPAGSAVFHNGLVAHGAGANMTNKPRRAMTCAYMPDGATFNGQKNVLPDVYFATLTVGDVLNDDTINPLVWKE